jgi:hypothetical protein
MGGAVLKAVKVMSIRTVERESLQTILQKWGGS